MMRILLSIVAVLLFSVPAQADMATWYGIDLDDLATIKGVDVNDLDTWNGVTISTEPDPVLQYNLDDNAANTTVAAAYGSTGTLNGGENTSAKHSTDAIEGTGSFQLNSDDSISVAATASWFTDEVFTVQWAVKGNEAGAHTSARFFADTGQNIYFMRNGNDTTIRLRVSSSVYPDMTVDDFDDGQWHMFRAVFNASGIDGGANTIRIYQKTGTGSWAMKDSDNTTFTISTVGASLYFFNNEYAAAGWGNGTNKGDQVIIWNQEVLP